jgi:hypothetical protein
MVADEPLTLFARRAQMGSFSVATFPVPLPPNVAEFTLVGVRLVSYELRSRADDVLVAENVNGCPIIVRDSRLGRI